MGQAASLALDVLERPAARVQPGLRARMAQLDAAPTPPPPRTALTGLAPGRASIQAVLPNISITSYFGARSLAQVQAAGITHVLVCANELPALHDGTLVSKKLWDLADNTHVVLQPFIEEATAFIDAAAAQGGHVLLVCAAGASRSAAVLIGYLMRARDMSFDEADALVRSARPAVALNPGFRTQLRAMAPGRRG